MRSACGSHRRGEAAGVDRLADGVDVGERPGDEGERRADREQLVAGDPVVGEHVADQSGGGVEVEDRLEGRGPRQQRVAAGDRLDHQQHRGRDGQQQADQVLPGRRPHREHDEAEGEDPQRADQRAPDAAPLHERVDEDARELHGEQDGGRFAAGEGEHEDAQPRLADMAEAAVLLVDDDAPIRRMLERTLTAEGYDVEAAADGGAALAAVERSCPTRSCSTWRCPGMDGLAVTRRLRAKGLRVPILLLTARDALARARRRARRRRRRLPRQAVRRRRADARACGRCCAATRRRRRRAARVRRPHARARDRRRAPRRPRPRAHPPRGRAARAAAAQRARRRHAASSRSRRSGAARARRRRTPSTATSPTCAASSATRR